MGGCRCTYKNCSLKSDGVTHMFHYPVFDKLRCHQWLTNAQKLEFLNLKVSQLKNRVVCQHHFKDDNFMNFLKDKLTFDAVPTLDGPYCDSSKLNQQHDQDASKIYSISLEDIENEYLTFNDKKANFSVKYGDFLTNCDLMDLDSLTTTNDNTQINTIKDDYYDESNNIIVNGNIESRRDPSINPYYNKGCSFPANNHNVISVQVTEVPIDYNVKVQGNANIHNENASQSHTPQNNTNVITQCPKTTPVKNNKLRKKITIIDQKEILDPAEVPIPKPVKLEPINPCAILTLPHKRKKVNSNSQLKNNQDQVADPDLVEDTNMVGQVVKLENNVNIVQTVPENINLIQNNVQSDVKSINRTFSESTIQSVGNTNKIPLQKSQELSTSNVKNMIKPKKNNQSLLKCKIPPERMAAIEEKRKFNMKLRDIIASCLDKLDDEETNDYNNSNVKTQVENNVTQKVSSYLSKDPKLPNIQDYTVAYLEARMKKMEDILLHKIDQNSRRIVDLQKSLKIPADKKVAYTQTTVNEELQKKHLYQEISKFLSPEANSLLYEELFINKYVQKIQDSSQTKKRKYR